MASKKPPRQAPVPGKVTPSKQIGNPPQDLNQAPKPAGRRKSQDASPLPVDPQVAKPKAAQKSEAPNTGMMGDDSAPSDESYEDDGDLASSQDNQPEDNSGNPRSEKSTSPVSDFVDMFFGTKEMTFQESSYVPETMLKPYNPDDIVQKDQTYRIYENMTKDDQVSVALQLKKDLVLAAGFEIFVHDTDPLSAKIKEDLEIAFMEDAEVPIEESLENILTAYEFGFSLSEKCFKNRPDGSLTLKFIKSRHPATWLIHTDERGNVSRYEQRTRVGSVDIDPKALIHYVNNGRFQNPYGRSDLRAAYAAFFIKQEIIKYYAIFMEKAASPTPVARYNKDAPQSAVDDIYNAIRKFQTKTAIAIPKEIEVEFLETKNNGEVFEKAVGVFNMFIGRALFIPDLLGFQGSKTAGGSYALGKDQINILFKHILKRRSFLEKIINQHIVKPLVTYNYGLIDKFPKFKLKPIQDQELIDLAKIWADAASKVFKPNPEEINHFRSLCQFPEGEVLDLVPAQQDPNNPVDPKTGMPMPIDHPAHPLNPKNPDHNLDQNGQPNPVPVQAPGGPPKLGPDGKPLAQDVPAGDPKQEPKDSLNDKQKADPAAPGAQPPKGAEPPSTKPETDPAPAIKPGAQKAPGPVHPPNQADQVSPPQSTSKKKPFKFLSIKDLPGDYAKKTNFKMIESQLDSFEHSLLNEVLPICKKSMKDLVKQIRDKKIIERKAVGRIDSLKMKYLSQIETAFRQNFAEAYQEAQKIAKSELEGTGISKKKFAQPALPNEDFMKVLEEELYQYIGDWEFKITQKARIEIINAIKDGLPVSEIEGIIDRDGEELTSVSMERYARTKFTEVMNRGRIEYFDSSGVVDAYQFSAILDDRTTDICSGLDGKTFSSGDQPVPPLHFNCRSLVVPITKYEDWKADKSANNGQNIDTFIENNKGDGFSVQ